MAQHAGDESGSGLVVLVYGCHHILVYLTDYLDREAYLLLPYCLLVVALVFCDN